MPYRLTEYGASRQALMGVPWRDLTDAEFREAKERHPGIEDRGYFEHVTKAEQAELAKEEAEQAFEIQGEDPDDEPDTDSEGVTTDGS